MPETIEPSKPSFTQRLAAERPKDAAEMKAMNDGLTKPVIYPPPTNPEPAQQKPPEAKPVPAQSTTDPDEEILSGKRSPRSDDFKRVKHAADEARKRADEFKAKLDPAEKELAEHRKAPKHNAEIIKQIESERDELKAKWQTVAAQFDSGFHAKYEARVGEAIAKIKDAVPADKMDKIGQLLQMPESEWKRREMDELLEDSSPSTIHRVWMADERVQDILASRKKELEDSGTILKSSAESRAKEQAERKEAYSKSFDAVLSKKSTGENALPILQVRDGDSQEVKDWNAGVTERTAVARAVFMDEFDSPEEKAEASIWAASAPGFLKELQSVQAENAQLKETLAKLQGSSPGIGSSAKADTGGKKMSFTERAIANAVP